MKQGFYILDRQTMGTASLTYLQELATFFGLSSDYKFTKNSKVDLSNTNYNEGDLKAIVKKSQILRELSAEKNSFSETWEVTVLKEYFNIDLSF
jgi:hypothetical protein